MRWTNWSGGESCEPERLHFARSVDDVCGVVSEAASRGSSVRVAGSGHSHYRLVPTSGIVLDVSGLSGLIDVDPDDGRARVWAGTTINALGRPLHDAGRALANQGDIDRQAIAGAVATGTHGTGQGLQNLAAMVTGLQLVTADGSVIECSESADAELFRAARLGLGAFGVVTQVELSTVPAYRLAETGWEPRYDELRSSIDDFSAEHRHFEFFWFPHTDVARAKFIDETDEPAVYPVQAEGHRRNWSYEVLPNHRSMLHTEMEYAVPVESSLACLDDIRSLIRADFTDVQWPVEYRQVAADDVWLSQAYQRRSATISVHQGVGLPTEQFFRACEEVFLAYDGRPHWGKVHYLDGIQLADAHPRWRDWWGQRDAADPAGLFLNERLRELRPSPAGPSTACDFNAGEGETSGPGA